MTDAAPHEALVRLAREERGRVLALLARRFGDVTLADDAVQDALVEAARTWPARGVPDNPPAWLLTVARRKGLDALRRAAAAERRLPAVVAVPGDDVINGLVVDDGPEVGDEHLRLILLCCHPALDPDAQVALTLRLVGGLTTEEIAAAFLVPEATLAQRIVRAKRKIRDAAIPLSIPTALDERIGALLGVLYLVFNEGYLPRGDGGPTVRVDLADEAIRLTRLVTDVLPGRAEVEGLLALQLYHRARMVGRGETDELVLLADQDRTRWDRTMTGAADAVLHTAMRRMEPGPYQLQAIIAGHHANAPSVAATDWPAIARAYAQLAAMDPSPVVALNRAVAVGMADGPTAGLLLIDRIVGLDDYHLFHAGRAELLARSGDRDGAVVAFRRAAALARNPAERRHLDRRAAAHE